MVTFAKKTVWLLAGLTFLLNGLFAQEKKVVFISEFVDKTDGLGVLTDPLPAKLTELIDGLGKVDARAPGEVQLINDIKGMAEEGADADVMKKAFNISPEEAEKLQAAGAHFILFGTVNIVSSMFNGAVTFNFALVDVETREVAVGLTATPAPFMTGGMGNHQGVFNKVDKMMENYDEIADKLARIVSIYATLPHEERVYRYAIDNLYAQRDSKDYKSSWMIIGFGAFEFFGLSALGLMVNNKFCGQCLMSMTTVSGSAVMGMGLWDIVQRNRINLKIWNLKRLYKKKWGHKYQNYLKIEDEVDKKKEEKDAKKK